MRRIAIWLAATVAGVALLFSYRTSTVGAPAAAARGADVLLAGHIHEAWCRHVRGTELWLVGDWPCGISDALNR